MSKRQRQPGVQFTAATLAAVVLFGATEQAAMAQSFTLYLAEGYRQLAGASVLGKAGAPDHFRQRSLAAAGGEVLAPLEPDVDRLDFSTFDEASVARDQLIESMQNGTRESQPLLAAIAQINFDCWVMPLPRQAGFPDSAECRRRFYFAFGGLRAGRQMAPSASVDIVQVGPSAAGEANSAQPDGARPVTTVQVGAAASPATDQPAPTQAAFANPPTTIADLLAKISANDQASPPASIGDLLARISADDQGTLSSDPLAASTVVGFGPAPAAKSQGAAGLQLASLSWQRDSIPGAPAAASCGSNCDAPDFVGPAADRLISELRGGDGHSRDDGTVSASAVSAQQTGGLALASGPAVTTAAKTSSGVAASPAATGAQASASDSTAETGTQGPAASSGVGQGSGGSPPGGAPGTGDGNQSGDGSASVSGGGSGSAGGHSHGHGHGHGSSNGG